MARRIVISANIKSNNKKYKTKNLHVGMKKGFYRHIRRPCPHCGKIVLLYPIITDGMVNSTNKDIAYETNGDKHNCIPKIKLFKKKDYFQNLTKEKAKNTSVIIHKYSGKKKPIKITVGELEDIDTELFLDAYRHSEEEARKAIEFLYFEVHEL